MRNPALVLAVGLLLGACSVDEATREACGEGATCMTTTAAPGESVTPAGTVPEVSGSSDTGCVDEAGTLTAEAMQWYPGTGTGWLGLSGEPVSTPKGEAFVAAAKGAMISLGDPAEGFIGSGRDLAREPGGCATHHYAEFTRGDEDVVITAWRLEAATSWGALPLEGTPTPDGASTLMSIGPHIGVVLAVAPDGTTVRVSAYGAHTRLATTGWPTTTVAAPDAPEWGPMPLTAGALRDLAESLLAELLSSRVA